MQNARDESGIYPLERVKGGARTGESFAINIVGSDCYYAVANLHTSIRMLMLRCLLSLDTISCGWTARVREGQL